MEHVRREVRVGAVFDDVAFARAFARFGQLYHVAPTRAFCAPDVLARFCELYDRPAATHRHSTQLRFEGVPLVAGILAPGMLVLEGEVDEERMGDW